AGAADAPREPRSIVGVGWGQRRCLVTHCRQMMLEELQRRNFSPTTVRSYLSAVERFARHFKCRPDRLNQTHLRSYQAYLLRTGQLQPKTVRLHVSALRFFFVKTLRRRYLLAATPYPK